jgi:hypothetical protein
MGRAQLGRDVPASGRPAGGLGVDAPNPLDTKIRCGAAAHARDRLPAILGLDLAGVVDAVAPIGGGVVLDASSRQSSDSAMWSAASDEQMTLYEAAYVLLEDGTKHQLWCETFMDGQRRCDISVVHVGDDEIEDVDQEWAKEMYFQLLGEVEERLRDARALAPVPERTLVNASLPRQE